MEWIAYLLLIPALGNDDFRTRERVHTELARVAPIILPILEANERHPIPEVALRCESLVNEELKRRVEQHCLYPKGWNRLPNICHLPTTNRYNDPFALIWFMSVAEQHGWDGILECGATKELLTWLYWHDGYTPRALRALLDEMAAVETNIIGR